MFKKVISKVMKSYIYSLLLRYVVPALRFPKGVSVEDVALFKAKVRRGDILLCKTHLSLASKLIPGDWDHAAIFTGRDRINEIAEMIAQGFHECDIDYFLKDCDEVLILRPVHPWSEQYLYRFINKCLSFKGRKYDKEFTLGVDSLYCFELVYHSDMDRKLRFDLDDLVGMGRPYLSSEGIYTCPNLKIVYSSVL